MFHEVIGRRSEVKVLNRLLQGKQSELLAIYGRRRVGKTFLIRNTYKTKIDFEIAGVQNANLQEQLQNFNQRLIHHFKIRKESPIPKNWLEAFFRLTQYLEKKKTKRKKVIFIDELPWIASSRSGFLRAFDNFWNTWGSQHRVVVVICGSAASWMIRNIIHNKGGLHNRVTELINLQPFTLNEVNIFLKKKHLNFNHYQILQIYMVMGGIPLYLSKIEAGESAVQAIDRICFSYNGYLRDEFNKLYQSLFNSAENHIRIIRALARKWKGITRDQIITTSGLSDGGRINRILHELVSSGFVTSYQPFQKRKKDTLYRLTDEYSIFYIRYIERSKPAKNKWLQLSQGAKWKSWSGYAFESICMKHIESIKKVMNVTILITEESSYIIKGDKLQEGTQIDLIMDRNDNTITLFEMKFYQGPYKLTKAYANQLRKKMTLFREKSKTNKVIEIAMITTFGMEPNQHSLGLIDHNLSAESLFNE